MRGSMICLKEQLYEEEVEPEAVAVVVQLLLLETAAVAPSSFQILTGE